MDDQIERQTKPAGCKDMDKTIKQKSKRESLSGKESKRNKDGWTERDRETEENF